LAEAMGRPASGWGALMRALRACVPIGWACAALASAPGAAAPADERFAQGLLWKVSRQGVPDSFVFGTIHVNDPRVAELPPPVTLALGRSRVFAMELATDIAIDPRVLDLEQFRDGRTLAALIGPEAYDSTRVLLAAQGVPEKATVTMKPWAAMMRVSRRKDAGGSPGLDQLLLAQARAKRMKIVALEWVEEQIAAFDGIPMDSQVALLQHVLDHRDALEAWTEPTIVAWMKGDLAELARFGDRMGDRYPGIGRHYFQLDRHLIRNRSVLMHHRLILPLRSGRVFVAVGAMHLYGANGLLAMLERDGYRVARIH
jgi:uncharacterized protein YbaP (TraB family)